MGDLRRTLGEVEWEIIRAIGFQYTISDPIPAMWRSAMVTEEVGEELRGRLLALEGIVQEKGDLAGLRKELIQVAALATAWADSLPR